MKNGEMNEEIAKTIEEDIRQACDVLRRGGLILYPTDTIWGVGCDATNSAAVQRVYALKRRADRKALLMLIDHPAKLEAYVTDVPAIAWNLIELTDKPLTIIYSHARNVAPELLAEDGSVGIRVTNEYFSHRLCQRFRNPIVSTSANVSGTPSPATFREVTDTIRAGVDYVVRYRQNDTAPAQPSGVLKVGDSGLIQVIRK